MAERLGLKHILTGAVGFLLLCHGTGAKAEDSLAEIRQELETNERLQEFYPEVCDPVAALENTPNRAHYQTVSGKRYDSGKPYAEHCSRFSWCGQQVILPDVPGSPSARAIIATRGLDAEVRGVKKFGRRPDLVIIDNPDTEETVNNPQQAKKLENRIDRAVGRLRRSTAARRPRAADDDPKPPCWIQLQVHRPETKAVVAGKTVPVPGPQARSADLWEEYVARRMSDQQEGDPSGRKAHQWHLNSARRMEARRRGRQSEPF